MDTKKKIIGFKPEKFIELLLKLDGRAKGQKVEVEVRKKNEGQVATA
ncbi:hypothetical protein [Anaerovibrio sp. RM50]|nr:hypothetical protein [Anaerovibrio sp. RM50]